MANTVGPQLEGGITLNLDQFEKAVNKFAKAASQIERAADKISESFSNVEKSLGGVSRAYTQTARAAERSSKTETDAAKRAQEMMDRKSNAVARAVNRMANFEQRVRSSSASQEAQNRIIARARAELDNYSRAVNNGNMSKQEMDNANTRMTNSLGAMNRQLKEATSGQEQSQRSQVANIKSLSQLQISYDRTANAIQTSALSVQEKEQQLAALDRVQKQAVASVREFGNNSSQSAEAISRFRQQAASASIAVRNVNAQARKRDLESWRAQMRDLTSSIQLALGPLSGVASRVTALTALFSRNAAPAAAFIASLTGMSVTLARSFKAGVDAEQQFLTIEGVVASLGDQAQATAQELYDLGTQTGKAFLTSEREAREAVAALATFRSIGIEAYEDVLASAQGLSQVVGGGLVRNTTRLARLLENPADNFNTLTRYGIEFNETMQEQILTLRAAGRIQEANAIILSRFNAMQNAAEKSAAGLAGQLDTAGHYITTFYENLFNTGGALENATAQAARLNKTLQELTESDAAESLAKAFATAVNVIGNTLNFLVENIKAVGTVVAALSMAALPRFVAWLAKVAATAYVGSNRMKALTRDISRAGVAATTTGRAFQIMGRALPWLQVATAIGTAIYMLTRMGRSAKEANEEVERSAQSVIDLVEAANFNDVTTEQMTGEIRELEERANSTKASIEGVNSQIEELSRQRVAPVVRFPGETDSDFTRRYREAREANRRLDDQIQGHRKTLSHYQADLALTNYRLKMYEDNAKHAADANRQNTQAQDEQVASIKRLYDEYMREEAQMEKLASEIEQMEIRIRSLTEVEGELSEENAKWLARAPAILKAMQDQHNEMKNGEDDTKRMSRAYAELNRFTRDAESETELLTKKLKELSDLEIAEEEGLVALANDLERMSDIIARMRENELEELAEKLGVNTSTLSSQEEVVDAVSEAWREQTKSILENNLALSQLGGALENARSLQDDLRGGVGGVEREYQKRLATIALLENAEDEAHQKIYNDLKAQMDLQKEFNKAQEERAKEAALRFGQDTVIQQLEDDYERRKQIIMEFHGWEEEAAADHMRELEQAYNTQRMWVQMGSHAQEGADLVGQALDTMSTAGRESSRAYQRLAEGRAIMNQATAISDIWANSQGNVYLAAAKSSLAAMQLGAQIKQIRSQNFADGGHVRGPGTGTSDSIPAWLSNGEFVMNARAVQKIGLRNLEAMNEGRVNIPRFAKGGAVQVKESMNRSSNGGSNVEVHIHNNSSVNVRQERSQNSDGSERLDYYIEDVVKNSMRRGRLDQAQSQNFGSRRAPIRR